MSNNNTGFTLIEVLVTLILVGILSVFIGTGIVFVSQAYVKATQSSLAALQGDVVMTRLKREFKNMRDVTSKSSTSIRFQRDANNCTIRKQGQELQLGFVGSSNQFNTLMDNVENFSLNFLRANGDPWDTGDGFDQLYLVEIDLTLDLSVPVELNSTVNPLYNNTYNGPRG